MFKAIDSRGGREIILLDREWKERVEDLRALDRKDRLVCQGCRQPVRVKAGAILRWHFAHKHLKECRFGLESPDLLAARAMLYARLQRQFGDAVTLEKHLEDPRFPRPVDCWVETGAAPLAYWIFDAQARPEVREGLRAAFKATGARVVWLFTAGMLHADAEEDLAYLSTTEREFLQEAYVDCELRGTRLLPGKSLYYLDPQGETLIACRGLHLVHEPQVYRGRRVCGPLAEVLVAPRTGELAHPVERERARELRRELAHREEAERERQEQEHREREQREQKEQERRLRLAREREERTRQQRLEREARDRALAEQLERRRREGHCVAEPPAATPPASRGALGMMSREGTCEICGKRTRDWSTYNNATGTCKCRECMGQKAQRG